MKVLPMLVAVMLVVTVASVAVGEEPAMPQPTAEHEALGTWVGSWSGEGVMKEGPFGPGGPMTWTEECTWFEGSRFHVVCRSQGDSPMGPMIGLGIAGYNADKGVYTHYGVDSTGWSGYSEGIREGDTWTFQSTETMGGETYHSRYSMTLESPTKIVFSWQTSGDGKTWTVMMEGTSTKR